MTHGPELRWVGDDGGRAGAGQPGIKGRKKWDSYSSIINKIYLKNTKRPFLICTLLQSEYL